MSQLEWTEAQWAKVNSAVAEEFNKVSVAGGTLPCYGPMAGSSESVSQQGIDRKGYEITVDDTVTDSFWTLRIIVRLSRQQVYDEAMASALFAFKRAASLLARTEDTIVFNGYDPSGLMVRNPNPAVGSRITTPKPFVADVIASTSKSANGLIHSAFPRLVPYTRAKGSVSRDYSDGLVEQVTRATNELEGNGFPGPYTCVLASDVFQEAHRSESGRLVLAADRIRPIVGGPLMRSGVMETNYGVVLSCAGDAIDLVVATPPKIQFLQVDVDGKYLFRVYERFVLRIKDEGAVVALALEI